MVLLVSQRSLRSRELCHVHQTIGLLWQFHLRLTLTLDHIDRWSGGCGDIWSAVLDEIHVILQVWIVLVYLHFILYVVVQLD